MWHAVSSFYPRPRAAGDFDHAYTPAMVHEFLSAPACGGRLGRYGAIAADPGVSIRARVRRATLIAALAAARPAVSIRARVRRATG